MFGIVAAALLLQPSPEASNAIATTTVQHVVRLEPRSPGVPLAGVTVSAIVGSSRFKGITDRRGEAVFRTPPGILLAGCSGDDVWCMPIRLRLNQKAASLPIWGQATVSGVLTPPVGGTPPRELIIQAVHSAAVGLEPIERRVPVVAGTYSTKLPVGRLDVRLATEGFAPVYFWSVTLAEGGRSLGSSSLRSGASVSGTALDPNTEKPVSGLRVQMAPFEGSSPSTGTSTVGRTGLTGFFQFHNVPVGRYRLIFSRGEKVMSVLASVEVLGDSEIRLDRLLLRPPVRLSLHLSPPVTPDGDPWELELAPTTPPVVGLPSIIKASAGTEGDVEFEGLMPGRYGVRVFSRDRVVLFEWLDVSSDMSERRDLPITKLRGRVRVGDKPMPATLAFSAGEMDRAIVQADEEGWFSGWMRTPLGVKRNAFVTVTTRSPNLRKALTLSLADEDVELDIRLEDSRIVGRVTDSRDRPKANIAIKAESDSGETLSATSDKDGLFELAPVSAIRYLVTAFDGNLPRSRPIDFDGGRPPVRLDVRLADGRSLRVQVLTPDGSAIAGAQVRLDPIGFGASFLARPTSASGSLQLPVPEDAKVFFARVVSDALGAWSGCVAAPASGDSLTLTLPRGPLGFGRITTEVGRAPDILVSADGAAWAFGDIFRWPNSLRGADRGALALFPGSYAVLSAPEPWEKFIERWCLSGPPNSLTWSTVVPGDVQSEIRFGSKKE